MLEAIKLGCIRGDRRIFSNLNFCLKAGALLQILGPNGSGKTSLLRMVCGLIEAAEGEIRWQGTNIHSLGEEYFSSLNYIGHRNGVKEELNSIENLRISSGLAGVELSHEKAKGILQKMGLGGREELPARLLSEGQRRRSALARLLSVARVLWVLDEVLTALDESAVRFMKSLIEEHLSKGGMAIIATNQELNISAGSLHRLELAS